MQHIVTVTAAASSVALTTLERVKSELSISNASHDALLTAKIGEASSDIFAHLSSLSARETLSETFWGAPNAANVLILGRDPVASIASVTVDDVAVDAAEYRLDRRAGLLHRLTADGYPRSWSWSKSVVIVYDAGYVLPGSAGRDLPAAIEAAAVELVSSYWAAKGRDPLIKAEDVPGVLRTEYWVGAVGAAGDLPPGVESKLAPFRRPIIA